MSRTAPALVFAFLLSALPVQGAMLPPDVTTFPNAPVDYISNASAFFPPRFQWNVDASLQPLLAAGGSPNYNATAGTYTSGLLTDPGYQVGLSGVLTVGSAAATNGVPVGSAGSIVSTASFTSVPAGFDGPAGTREVYAAILSLDFTDGSGNNLRAGATANNGTPASYGQFQSTTGNPTNDFPAKSFFDVFFDVDIPGIGTLTNVNPNGGGTPLVVQTDNDGNQYNLVQAVNGPATNVPTIYFLTVNPNLGNSVVPGDVAGTLQLLQTQISPAPEPATWVLLAAGVTPLALRRRKSKCG